MSTSQAAPMTKRRRWRIALWSGAGLLLLAPAVAMALGADVSWGAEDFAIFGGMLAVAGGAVEVAMRLTSRPRVRLACALVVAAAFLLVWAELAVGILPRGS